MKMTKNILSVLLAAVLLAATLPLSVFATAENTPKEEVIYINLDADGNVKEIVAVNIFDPDADGNILDYGDYTSVRNMTTTDPITYSDGTVQIDAKQGKLYYEGTLNRDVIPWKIGVRYALDGVQYSASEIAGKSGALKLSISVSKNEACHGNFFEGLALQISVTLDTAKCGNIRADGATVANVGGDKQLTYTVLPGQGAELEITADVTDFEMDGIAINGVKLGLEIDVDDTEIQEKIETVVTAVTETDDGAANVQEGASRLSDSIAALTDGAGDLTDGAAALNDGLYAIRAQSEALVGGAYTAFTGLCSAAESVLNAQLTANGLPAVTLTPETYEAVLSDLLALLSVLPESMAEQAAEYTVAITELKAQLDSYRLFCEGLQAYTAAVGEAADGAAQLHEGTDTLQTALECLQDGAQELCDGTDALKDGTAAFADRISDPGSQVTAQIDRMLSQVTGSEAELGSFVSERNVNVESVQFVIQTEAIRAEEPEPTVPAAEEKLTFWQKLLRLFGLY